MAVNGRGEVPTQTALLQMINAGRTAQAIYVAAKLGIADLLSDGPKTVVVLAELTATHSPSLHRLLRALASLGIFVEQADHSFGLTPLADLLRSDGADSLRSVALFVLDPYWWTSTGELLYCIQTGQPAPPHLHGVDEWEYLAQHHDTGAVFQAAMTANTLQQIPAILEAYDFSTIRKLVDVGGGHGTLLAGILQAHPTLHGILFDHPQIVSYATSVLEDGRVADRCQVVSGDLFGDIPSGGDTYVLKLILHDWDDRRALQILANLRRSISTSATVLLVEHVILPGNDPQPGKLLDLAMLAYNGGRERSAEEWETLLDNAGFRLTRLIPTRVAVSILECKPQ
jgi:hypothetical protein